MNDDDRGAPPAPGPETPRGPGPREGRRLSPARARMLDRLRAQPEPLTLAALCRATGLHENTVREHLDGLVRAGLVRRQRAAPSGRGRPAWLYQATGTDEHSEYAGLASALASGLVHTAPDHETAVRGAALAGEAWGRDLARDGARESPDAATDHPGAVPATVARGQVVELLDVLGFDTAVSPDRPEQVRLTRCPLLQAAVQHPDVVCAVHLGIVRGALEEYGADPEGTELHPFAEPGACRLVVPPTA